MGEVLRVLTRLSDETQVHHPAADADLDRYVFRPTATALDYRTYLARALGFVAPVEHALAQTPELAAVLPLEARLKAPHLRHDLGRLGLTKSDIDALPRCTSVPTFCSAASALGWLYVIERPMLASAVVRGHLDTQLHAEIQEASSYLSCYAGQTGSMWRELGRAMDRVACSPAIADRIVLSAHEAFRLLERWHMRGTGVAGSDHCAA